MHCLLFDRQVLNQFRVVPRAPKVSSFRRSSGIETVSKALARSRKTPTHRRPLSRCPATMFVKCATTSSVDLPERKPYWLWAKRELFSRKDINKYVSENVTETDNNLLMTQILKILIMMSMMTMLMMIMKIKMTLRMTMMIEFHIYISYIYDSCWFKAKT